VVLWRWREFVGCLVVIVVAALLCVSSSALDFRTLISQKVPSPKIVYPSLASFSTASLFGPSSPLLILDRGEVDVTLLQDDMVDLITLAKLIQYIVVRPAKELRVEYELQMLPG